jgi:hypothetical protein
LISSRRKTPRTFKEIIFDHGLWSAANLLNWVLKSDVLLNSADVKSKVLATEVIEAIALHNYSQNIDISISTTPIAALLQICDEIHEWQRLTLTKNSLVKQEAKSIILSHLDLIDNKEYHFTHDLTISFRLESFGELLTSGWLFEEFGKSKQKILKIKLDNSINPKKILLELNCPIA